MSFALETITQRALEVELPAATAGPALFGRQDEFQTCGYWSFSDRDLPFSEFSCGGDGCTTSDGYHGCADTFATTCYNSDDSYCSGDVTLGDRELCCTESTWSNCVTASKSDGGRWLSAFECWAGLSGEQSVFVTPYERTIIHTEGDSTVTSTESNTGVETSVATGERGSATTTGSGDDSGSNDGGSGGGGGSSTPVGAIVGGVIGGVALILLVAFGIWFMRFYKKKHAGQAGAEPYRGGEAGYYGAGGPGSSPPAAPGSTAGYSGYNGGGYGEQQQQPHGAAGGWGYQLPAEQKPEMAPVEMPDSTRRTHELQ